MDDFEKQIEQVFVTESIPDLDESTIAQLKNRVKLNKTKHTTNSNTLFWKRFAICCCAVILLLPCILLPILLNGNEKFYAENNAVQVNLTSEFLSSYINKNYNQFSFILETCDAENITGLYDENRKNLLAMKMVLNKNDMPYTNIKMSMIVDRYFQTEDHNIYVKNATKVEDENYILYKKEIKSMYKTNYYFLIEYKSISIYLIMNKNDVNFIEKFLSN